MDTLAREKNLLVLPTIDTPSSGCPARSLTEYVTPAPLRTHLCLIIYIYIYVCVCVCVCVYLFSHLNNLGLCYRQSLQ